MSRTRPRPSLRGHFATVAPHSSAHKPEAARRPRAPRGPRVAHPLPLSLRYRPGLTRRPGGCILAGAGKSTIAAALFRLVGAEAGQILLDGVDAASVNVYQLRSRLAIIPQARAPPRLKALNPEPRLLNPK